MTYEHAIEMKSVSKAFKDFAIKDVNLVLPKGSIMGLIGENGAGKSTTIRLIMHALKKDSGQITVLGMNNEESGFDQMKEDIGVVLDEAHFPLIIDARAVNQMMKHTYQNWDESTYYHYLHQFNLPEKKKFKDFSRGMKMKLSIAVALSHNPKLLILDEATGGLDPIIRDEILDILNDFTRDPDHSILISSHITSDLEKICDYIAFIHDGNLCFCEEKDALLESLAVINCTEACLADIPAEAVIAKKAGKYNYSCLVKRQLVSPVFHLEKVSIEDIILYHVKGER